MKHEGNPITVSTAMIWTYNKNVSGLAVQVSCSVPPTRLWDCLNLFSIFKHSSLNFVSLIHKETSLLLILNEFSGFTITLWNICRLSEPRQPRNQVIAAGVASSRLPLGIHKPVITWNASLRLHQCIVKYFIFITSPPNLVLHVARTSSSGVVA